MEGNNKAFLLQTVCMFILMLLSIHLYSQTNSITHSKKKISVTTNNSGPSLKETVAWIADKLNRYSRPRYIIDDIKNDTISYEYNFLNFSCSNTEDSVTNLTFSIHSGMETRLREGALINSTRHIHNKNPNNGPENYDFIPTKGFAIYKIPFKYIIGAFVSVEAPFSSVHSSYVLSFDTSTRKPMKMLAIKVIPGKIMYYLPSIKQSFVPSGDTMTIPIDFSQEKNLEERMIKAIEHLKTFFPKEKEVF